MKYLHGLVVFSLLFVVQALRAQIVSTYSILSTAYDRSTGVFHPLGAVDGGWFLIRTQAMAFPLNAATIINYPNSPTHVVPNAGNSSFPGIISNRCINRVNNTASTGLLLLTYRTYFTLPNLSATSNRYSLQFKLSADDAVDNVQLNGTVKGQFLSPTFNNLPQYPKPYILNIPVCDPDFVSGQNYIDITIADAGGSVCFYGEVTLMETTNLVGNPTISATASPPQLCAGQPVTLAVSGASSYTWSTGTVNANAVVSPTVTTSYTVNGTVTTCTGTSASSAVVTVSVSPALNLTANASHTILCPGESSTLTAAGASSYTWTATGLTGNPNSPIIVVNPVGTTFYTLTGQTGSCINSTTLSVTVISNTVIVQDIVICPGLSGTLTASGAAAYSWSNAATLSASTGNSVVATPSTTQSYTVTGTTGACTSSAVATVSLSSNPLITAHSAMNTVCAGTSVTLSATGAGFYAWSPATVPLSANNSTVTSNPTVITTYTVTGGIGTCTNTAFVTVNVYPQTVISVSDQTICAGSSATLTASGVSSYTWLPGSINSSSVVVSPLSTSVYTVTGTSASGCVISATAKAEVIPLPALVITASPSMICPGAGTTLSATGAASYTWLPGGSVTATSTVSPLTTNTYTVFGSSGTSPDCTSSGTVLVNVLPLITPTLSTKEEVCLGQSTRIYAAGGNVYHWSPSTGIKNPNDPVITVSPSVTTVYSVSVSNNSVCPVTATVEIIVHPLPIVNAGNDTIINMDEVISLNGTGNVPVGFVSGTALPLNCTYCSSLMINPQENTCYTLMGENEFHCLAFDEVCVTIVKDWEVYIPNTFTPNSDGINDSFRAYGYGILSIDLMIFDRWGELIFKEEDTRTGWDGKRKGTLCEQGIYIYKMTVHVMSGKKSERVGHVTLLPKNK